MKTTENMGCTRPAMRSAPPLRVTATTPRIGKQTALKESPTKASHPEVPGFRTQEGWEDQIAGSEKHGK